MGERGRTRRWVKHAECIRVIFLGRSDLTHEAVVCALVLCIPVLLELNLSQTTRKRGWCSTEDREVYPSQKAEPGHLGWALQLEGLSALSTIRLIA